MLRDADGEATDGGPSGVALACCRLRVERRLIGDTVALLRSWPER
jgi:hypothetical protein